MNQYVKSILNLTLNSQLPTLTRFAIFSILYQQQNTYGIDSLLLNENPLPLFSKTNRSGISPNNY